VPFVRDLVRPRREAAGEELLLRAERALLRLARVNQYRSFLASPVSGRAEVVYRFRTVAGTAAASPPEDDDDGNERVLVLALAAGGIVALGGAVVAWAHL
jgi:hypothetical protein